jgi:hypothetical protein
MIRPHTRRRERIELPVWQSTCVICGEPFEVATDGGITSKSFAVTTCPAHRMTPSERAKLRFAKAEKRRAVFEAIKQKKLAGQVKATEKESTDG